MKRRPLLRGLGVVGSGVAIGGAATTFASAPATARAPTPLIDDFEDGSLNAYTIDRDASGASIVSEQTYNGSKALKLHGTGTELLSFSGLANYPERGDSFSVFVYATDGAQDINITYGGQDKANRYVARVEFDADNIRLFRYENDTLYLLAKELPDSGIGTDEWYEVRIDWSSNCQHTMSVYTIDGTLLKQISATEATWADGGFGYDGYLYDGGTVYFDYASLREPSTSLGDVLSIDDFEDGDVSEYSIDRNASGVSVVSAPTFTGSKALEIDGTNSELLSIDGLSNYPRPGDTFSTFVRAVDGAAAMNITYGAQDENNRYVAKVNFSNGWVLLFRYEDGTLYNIASSYNVPSLTDDTWYEIAVHWGINGEHLLTVYDTAGNTIKSIAATDTTWLSGGFGYDAYLSNSGGSMYFDSSVVTQTKSLGTFEQSTDGWTATGSSSLSRVDRSQEPAPVTQGEHALKIEAQGESHPGIGNQDRVVIADFIENPYVLADVLPSTVENTDSPIVFQFKYYSGSGSVETSPEVTVRQKYGAKIAWDMSTIDNQKLASPQRLELSWSARDDPPSSGFVYDGSIYLDNVRLSSRIRLYQDRRWSLKQRQLQRENGFRVDVTVEELTEKVQKGKFIYRNGTEIAYTGKLINNNITEMAIDGEKFRFGSDN